MSLIKLIKNNKILICTFFFLTIHSAVSYSDASTLKVADVDFEKELTTKSGDALVLNGAGIRKKYLFNVYAAGLYLPQKANNLPTVLEMPGAKQIHMHFLMKVSQKKLIKSLDEGFEANHSPDELEAIEKDIQTLKTFFKNAKKGDTVVIDFTQSKGTQIWFNKELQGLIPGDLFIKAILKIWLGEKPADKKLKNKLFGN